jgi:hypothetical protein
MLMGNLLGVEDAIVEAQEHDRLASSVVEVGEENERRKTREKTNDGHGAPKDLHRLLLR